jgi:hypothetical protein
MTLPALRRPTRWERLAFRLLGRWPNSYVSARLHHEDECYRVLARMTPEEQARALLQYP